MAQFSLEFKIKSGGFLYKDRLPMLQLHVTTWPEFAGSNWRGRYLFMTLEPEKIAT